MTYFRLVGPNRLCSFFMTMLFAALVAFGWPCPADSQEAPESFQVQIGSATGIEGTRFFTAKASRVLNEPAYVIHWGQYYVVLVGHFQNEEDAKAKLMQVRQHYNGMVVRYDVQSVVAGYENGSPLDPEEMLDMLLSGERKRKARKQMRETAPIRTIAKEEAGSLESTVLEGLRNVKLESCTLSTSEKLAGYTFRTTARLADLDPYSLHTEKKHGEHLYIVLEARKGGKNVTTQQLKGGKAGHTRKDSNITLRLFSRDEVGVERVATALQELITFCSE